MMVRKTGRLTPSLPFRNGRRSRYLLLFTMLMLLLVVTFTVTRIVPLGPERGLSERQARKLFSEATRWQQDSLFHSAAEKYERIVDSPRVSTGLRAQAARRLADLSRDELNQPEAAEAALEKAYFFTTDESLRKQLQQELNVLRQPPAPPAAVADQPTSAPVPDAVPTSPSLAAHLRSLPPMLPDDATRVARIGPMNISLEEILYAWSHFYGNRPPADPEFENFVRWYLDMALIAQEARRRGLHLKGRGAWDLRLNLLLSLNQSMNKFLLEQLPLPDEPFVRDYYERRREAWRRPARVRAGHMVVKAADLPSVQQALTAGEAFAGLARRFSLDPDYDLGWIQEGQTSIPNLGDRPRLVDWLTTHDEGATTGPIPSGRGYHWFHILEREPPTVPALSAIRTRLVTELQKAQLDRTRQRMLRRLRDRHDIEIIRQAPAPASRRPGEPPHAGPGHAEDTITTGARSTTSP